MHLNFLPHNERKDANNEKPTVDNVNAVLNQKPTSDDFVISVMNLTKDGSEWTAQTLKRKVGETEFVAGQTVNFGKSSGPESASSVAEKIRAALEKYKSIGMEPTTL